MRIKDYVLPGEEARPLLISIIETGIIGVCRVGKSLLLFGEARCNVQNGSVTTFADASVIMNYPDSQQGYEAALSLMILILEIAGADNADALRAAVQAKYNWAKNAS